MLTLTLITTALTRTPRRRRSARVVRRSAALATERAECAGTVTASFVHAQHEQGRRMPCRAQVSARCGARCRDAAAFALAADPGAVAHPVALWRNQVPGPIRARAEAQQRGSGRPPRRPAGKGVVDEPTSCVRPAAAEPEKFGGG